MSIPTIRYNVPNDIYIYIYICVCIYIYIKLQELSNSALMVIFTYPYDNKGICIIHLALIVTS